MPDQQPPLFGGGAAPTAKPRRTVVESSPAVEVVTQEPTALATLLPRDPEGDAPPVAALAMMENALQIADRMAAVVTGLRNAAIKMSDPVDWVLNKDKQGNETGMLIASGSQKIASLYGISLQPLPGAVDLEPTKTQINGILAYNLKCLAGSRLLGRYLEIEATRREDEEFTGRETDAAGKLKFNGGHSFEPDLKKSVRTLAMSTAVRELVGLKNVSRRELDACWEGTTKTTAGCRFGHGYGTSGDRTAAGVAEPGTGSDAQKLWEEILRRVSGDTGAASQLLKDITQNKDGQYGKTSPQQFTKPEQVEWAWKKLKMNPVFGDKAQNGGE